MKVGILGSGDVGQTLARAFFSEGHSVTLGTRTINKEKIIPFGKENPAIAIKTFADAASFGELLVLAVSGSAAEQVVDMAGRSHFKDKVLIDVSNPISGAPPTHGVLQFFTTPDESLMERIQRMLPEARVVKAFNSVGSDLMYKPRFPGGQPTMFICGNDETAKRTVSDILTAFGWETEDMGTMEAARAIEPLAVLWCIPGFIRNRWSHAFKLLKK